MMMMMMMKQLNMFPWFYLYVAVCLHYLLGCCLPVRPYSLDVGNSAGQTRSGGEIKWSMIPLNSPRYGLYVTQRNTHKREKNMDLWPEKGKSCKRDKVLLWHLCWCCNMTQQKFAKGPGLWFLYQVHCSSKYKAFNQLGEKKKTSWMSMAINSTLRLRPSCLHTLIEARQESLEDPESKSSHEGLKMV